MPKVNSKRRKANNDSSSLYQTSIFSSTFRATPVDFGGLFITIQGRGSREAKAIVVPGHLFGNMDGLLPNGLGTRYRLIPERLLSQTLWQLFERVKELDQDKIAQLTGNEVIMVFQSSTSAHEAMVKAAKRAVSVVLGNADVTEEELIRHLQVQERY